MANPELACRLPPRPCAGNVPGDRRIVYVALGEEGGAATPNGVVDRYLPPYATNVLTNLYQVLTEPPQREG